MKHKLDSEVEDILQHYGIKGMRWDVRRTAEEIAADAQAGVDAVGEKMDNDDLSDLVDDVLDQVSDVANSAIENASKKLSGIGSSIFSLGKSLVAKYDKHKRDERRKEYNKKQAYREGVKIYMQQGRKPTNEEVRKLKSRDFMQERTDRRRQQVLLERENKRKPTLSELAVAPKIKWQKRNYNKPSVSAELNRR